MSRADKFAALEYILRCKLAIVENEMEDSQHKDRLIAELEDAIQRVSIRFHAAHAAEVLCFS